MPKKKISKKISNLEASFRDVLVRQKIEDQALLEIFVEKPENITQKNLGVLAGILEVNDNSKDSSYVVNYLISVIKKEYYSKTKRGAIESFEAALNKANLALAKLAEHGNINWLGKINAIILAIEKNNIHISQTGSAKVLLLREKSLTDLSEGAVKQENPNPFKTFIDVLSGRLEKDDSLILATDSIFEIFSFEEIKRSALKFSPEEFIRFLQTALGNELEKAAVLIARMEEIKSPIEITKETAKDDELNAFSQKTFSKASSKKPEREILRNEEKQLLVNEIKEDLKNESDEFIDKKTGHIYIKEDFYLKEKKFWEGNIIEAIQLNLKESLNLLFSKISNFKRKITSINLDFKKIKKIIDKINWDKILFIFKDFFATLKEILIDIFSFFISTGRKIIFETKKFIPKKHSTAYPAKEKILIEKNTFYNLFVPHLGKIKRMFFRLDYSQKIYTILILLFILIVPYFIVKFQNRNKTEEQFSQEIIPEIINPLKQDKNVLRIDNLQTIASGNEISKIINLNGKIFFADKNSLRDIENNQSYPFPDDFSSLKIVSEMNDLNLIFLISREDKIISWSPISKKFQSITIEISSGWDIAFAKTYLTYLYLLDRNQNQIYRYPRANEGFGEKNDWLKNDVSLKEISDMAIGENIFLAQDGSILKFFQGKKQAFAIEETATPIYADKLYTKRDSSNFYALDKKNSRIIKFDLDGKIISQFYNSEISQAQDFEINEESNLAYFYNGNEIKSFEMK